MARDITLSDYVKQRSGVSLGADGSMSNMLKRSLGAKSFPLFWNYWNPIWGYYLSRNVMRPLNRHYSASVATLLTFLVSGGLHDLAISLIRRDLVVFVTPWFALMGGLVVASNVFRIAYAGYTWVVRMIFNLGFIVGSYYVTVLLKGLLA